MVGEMTPDTGSNRRPKRNGRFDTEDLHRVVKPGKGRPPRGKPGDNPRGRGK
jgi:hypothetical protein